MEGREGMEHGGRVEGGVGCKKRGGSSFSLPFSKERPPLSCCCAKKTRKERRGGDTVEYRQKARSITVGYRLSIEKRSVRDNDRCYRCCKKMFERGVEGEARRGFGFRMHRLALRFLRDSREKERRIGMVYRARNAGRASFFTCPLSAQNRISNCNGCERR